MADLGSMRISSNPYIARDTMVLRLNGEIVYAGPLRDPDVACDEMILNPEDEADCLDYIEARLRESAT